MAGAFKETNFDDPVSIHSYRIIINHPNYFLNQLNISVKRFPDLLSGKNFKYLCEKEKNF
jgi:hypothetical protein